jgi:DNA uptake protein ComE-like DNA-binding protein
MKRSTHNNRGAALIVTLLVVVVLASLVLSMTRQMRIEAMAARNLEASAQAKAIAEGAVAAVMRWGEDLPTDAIEIGGGYVWMLHIDPTDDKEYTWGIAEENAKLNLNSATAEMLELLPGMTPQLAASIVDWRDADSDPEAEGAENDYYTLLDDPYQAKNGPLETVEELLLVRGFTPMELYGEDANRNGILDPNEDDGDVSLPPDNEDGKLDLGIYPFVTVYSRQAAAQDGGDSTEPVVNVNRASNLAGDDDTQALVDVLRESMDEDRAMEVAQNIVSNRPHRNMIDLYYKSQMSLEEFGAVETRLTATQGNNAQQTSVVNINKAPREVLITLPGLDEADADALISYRAGSENDSEDETSTSLSSVAWVTQVLDREKALAIGSYITAHSDQHSVDLVAVSPGGRAFERYRLVYDTSSEPAKILLWQRLTHLGWPLERELLDQIRAGATEKELATSTDRGAF